MKDPNESQTETETTMATLPLVQARETRTKIDAAENAKRLLLHYMRLAQTGTVPLDFDAESRLTAVVDSIIEAAIAGTMARLMAGEFLAHERMHGRPERR